MRVDDLCWTDAEGACLAELRRVGAEARNLPAMENHCARAFVIAEELARRDGLDVDRELLLCAAWLHDAGLYPPAATDRTYVADGRRLAERLLDWPPERMTRLGDAIEYHHELRSQWERGPEVELMRRADLVEVSQTAVTFGLPQGLVAGPALGDPAGGHGVGDRAPAGGRPARSTGDGAADLHRRGVTARPRSRTLTLGTLPSSPWPS